MNNYKKSLLNQTTEKKEAGKIRVVGYIVCLLVLISAKLAFGQPNDGVPDINFGKTTDTVVTYSDAQGNLVAEVFKTPTILPDFGKVKAVEFSPIDPNRNFSKLPNFGLAKWHWWLFGFEVLPRAQRQYSDCIGEIKGYQKILGLPLIDSPTSELKGRIDAIREYTVAFEAIQPLYDKTKAPDLEAAIAHAEAAVFSVNLTVLERDICEQAASFMQGQVRAWIERQAQARVAQAVASVRPSKKPNRR